MKAIAPLAARQRSRPLPSAPPAAQALRRAGLGLAGVAALSLAGAATAAGEPVTYQPYRAVYEITSAPDSSGPVLQMEGVTVEEWLPACDGAVSNRETVLTFVIEDGRSLRSSSRVSKWESAAGDEYRFFATERGHDGGATVIGGSARRENGRVIVEYTHPEPETLELPGEVLFPWQHLRKLAEAARAGAPSMTAYLFIGESLENDPSLTVVQLLKPVDVAGLDLSGVRGVDAAFPETAWRYSSAAFAGPDEAAPWFESTGVGTLEGFIIEDRWLADDTAMQTTLQTIEMLPPVTCP